MDTLQILTLKTATAIGRLADLQRRADHAPEKASPVIKPALRELTTALEELQVANEHLQAQVDDVAQLRWAAQAAEQRLDEFADCVPLPCVWTDEAGVIQDGNKAACELLNISKPRLPGKPLMLFVTDRTVLFGALERLTNRLADGVEEEVTVRPRERRPKRMRISAKRLAHDARCLWILSEPATPLPAE
jgi:PAS domain-containing protein